LHWRRRSDGDRRGTTSVVDAIMNISNVVAIVTDAGSELRAATARALAGKGAKVAVVDHNEVSAKAIAAEIGGIAIACDV